MTPLRLAIILLALLLSACANTGPADDGFENSQESVDIGKLQENDSVNRVVKKTIESFGTVLPGASE